MRIVLMTALVLSTFVPQPNLAQAESEVGRQAAEAWLSLADAGDGGATWDAAGTLFKTSVPREQWQMMLQAAREPLGALETRTVKSSTVAKTLPGAPDGLYVVMQYDSSFERKEAAVETITVVRESDDLWRVVGYFIR